MGGNTISTEKKKPNIGNGTELLISPILNYETLPYLTRGHTKTFGTFKIPDKFNENFKDEIQTVNKTWDTYGSKRLLYKGDKLLCCTTKTNFYWHDDNNNTSNTLNNKYSILATCDPRSKQLSINDYCDETLSDICFRDYWDNPLKKYITQENVDASCIVWIDAVIKRNNEITNQLNTYMSGKCSTSINNKFCKNWISSIRLLNNDSFNDLADSILYSQPLDIKNNDLKCSFPSYYDIMVSKRVIEPRQCWNPDCGKSELWQLLKRDLNVRNTCSIYGCNIKIDSIRLNKSSSVNISCKQETYVNVDHNTNIDLMNQVTNVTHINNGFIYIIIILCFIIYLW